MAVAEEKQQLVAMFGDKGEVWRYGYWEVSSVMAYRRDVSRFVAKQGEAAQKISEEKAKSRTKKK